MSTETKTLHGLRCEAHGCGTRSGWAPELGLARDCAYEEGWRVVTGARGVPLDLCPEHAPAEPGPEPLTTAVVALNHPDVRLRWQPAPTKGDEP